MLKGGDATATQKSSRRLGFGFLQPNNQDNSPNRNYELESLRVRYDGLCQNFKTLNTALKLRHEALLKTAKSRVAVRLW